MNSKKRVRLIAWLLCMAVFGSSVLTGELSVSADTWSDWSDVAPSDGSASTQTRTMYRYRDKSYTTSNSSSLSGWTWYSSSTSWGAYSDWQDAAVSESATRNVETRSVLVSNGYTQYRYKRYCSNNCSKGSWRHFCPTCARNMYGGTWYEQYTDWMTTPVTTTGTGNYCPHYSYKNENQKTYIYNGQNWYYQEVQQVPATYKTQYRYRDSSTTHYYYKWSSWSSWSTVQPTSYSDREVDTKTQYRYQIVQSTESEEAGSSSSKVSSTDVETTEETETTAPEASSTDVEATEETEATASAAQATTQGSVNIYANGFTISSEQAAAKDSLVNYIKILSGVRATQNGVSIDRNQITVDLSLIQVRAGRYAVKFTYKTASITVFATVNASAAASTQQSIASKKKVKVKATQRLKIGKKVKVNGTTYKVTSVKKKTVSCIKGAHKKKVVVASKIKIMGKSYRVTSIAKKAFYNNKKVETVIFGKYITAVGSSAFANCKKLNRLHAKPAKNLKPGNIGRSAFKNTNLKHLGAPNKYKAKFVRAYTKNTYKWK